MSEKVEIICDQCGAVAPLPVYGWVSLKPAKKSKIDSNPPAKGDFCGTECLNQYVDRMEIQRSLDDVIGEASKALDAPAEDEGGAA